MFPENRRNERGFTVIELLIVIAVFTIALAIAIPGIRSVRNDAFKNQLARLTGIDAPGPYDITDAQRALIRTPLSGKVWECEVAYTRCEANRKANIANARKQLAEIRLSSPGTVQEANDTLKLLSATEAGVRRAEEAPLCSRDEINRLNHTREVYGIEPVPAPTQ